MIGGVGWHGNSPVYPLTGPAFLAQTGFQMDSLWLCNEAAGDVIDQIGANDLPAIAAPTYGQIFRARRGIKYGAADANRASNILQPGLGSALYGTAFWITAFEPVSNNLVCGLSNGAAAPAALIGLAAISGDTFGYVSDNVLAPLQLQSNFTADALTNPRMFFSILQVDRAADDAQLLITDGRGDYDLLTGSVAGFATLTLAGQSWGFGARGFVGGVANTYGFARLGASIEGAGVPLQIARRLRWIG